MAESFIVPGLGRPAASAKTKICVGRRNFTDDYTSKQKRRVTPQIKREMQRRSAIEPVIGHLKNEHRMGRNYLHHSHGDAINAVLAAVGYNFRLLVRWLRALLCLVWAALLPPPKPRFA